MVEGRVEVVVTTENGRLASVTIAGRAVTVLEGTLTLDDR